MADIKAGSIYSSVEVRDNSAKGFRSAANNAKTYQESMRQVQDQLFPIQNALKGGMFAGASLTGIGLLTSNFNTLSTTLQGVTSQFSGLGSSLGNFSSQPDFATFFKNFFHFTPYCYCFFLIF